MLMNQHRPRSALLTHASPSIHAIAVGTAEAGADGDRAAAAAAWAAEWAAGWAAGQTHRLDTPPTLTSDGHVVCESLEELVACAWAYPGFQCELRLSAGGGDGGGDSGGDGGGGDDSFPRTLDIWRGPGAQGPNIPLGESLTSMQTSVQIMSLLSSSSKHCA